MGPNKVISPQHPCLKKTKQNSAAEIKDRIHGINAIACMTFLGWEGVHKSDITLKL